MRLKKEKETASMETDNLFMRYIMQCGGAHSMSQRGVYGKERDNAG